LRGVWSDPSGFESRAAHHSLGPLAGSADSAGWSIATDVSIRPRGWRLSGTGRGILVDQIVQILPKARGIHGRCTSQRVQKGGGGYEPAEPDRRQLSHRDSISSDHKGLSTIQGGHDLAAFVMEGPLGDLSCHAPLAAPVLRASRIPVAGSALYPDLASSRRRDDAGRLRGAAGMLFASSLLAVGWSPTGYISMMGCTSTVPPP